MAEHRIPSLGQVRFTHILTAGGGGHLCSNGGGVPLVPTGGYDGLVGIISWAWQGTEDPQVEDGVECSWSGWWGN